MSGPVLPESVVAYPLDARFRNYQGVLVVSHNDVVLELSESAAFIACQVDGSQSVRDIGVRLAEKYETEVQQAVSDTLELLAELAQHGLVVVERQGHADEVEGRGR